METVETRRMKFGIFMTLQPPSIICYLASIHYILTHRGTRQALHHHGPLVLLFVGLFTVIFDLSMILDFLRTGFVTPRNEGYCIKLKCDTPTARSSHILSTRVTSIEKLMSQLRMLESKQPYVNENNLSVRNNRYNFYNNVIISWFYLPLFGEGPAERRKRLQNLISSLYDDEIAKVLRKNEEDDERVEDTKEYHEGLDELQTARCWIAEYSLSMQRAKEHIEKLKEYVAIPEVYRTANIQGL
ncbi:unnamed protein product [Rotaria socialis]|uniref:Uncharacterized protein n=4 Tax=Rotaria TaxID=231623 RepID=A0A818BMF0_9BILA|nr:unnamed protein product [Rotaria socialis]